VGGDFMFGRFYVSLLPLLLLGVESHVHRLFRAVRGGIERPVVAVLATALLLATTQEIPLYSSRRSLWGIVNENRLYPIVRWSPLKIDHMGFNTGRRFGRRLKDRGIEPVLASGGIGMLGY
jgi:hypothetical protein